MTDNLFPYPSNFSCIASPLLGSYFFDELIKSIDNSKLFIYTIQYQWKWNIHQRFSKVQMLGSAIARAKKRNVNINCILNNESPKRNLSKINTVTANQLSRMGIAVRLIKTPSILHTKLWIIDNEETFIGSHNISSRSLSINEEVSVKITNTSFAIFMKQYFENLWGLR
jgi:phosphatidylserine/phosphatidylglycerophosphate/cardiolipin synthase-like enzyme